MKTARAKVITAFLSFLISIGFSAGAAAESADVALTKYIKALNDSMPPYTDTLPVTRVYAKDGVHYDVNQAKREVGRAEIAQFFAGFKDRVADWNHVEKNRVIQGNRAVWEGVAQGHERQSGKLITLPIVFFLDFDNDGKVREKRVYVDLHLVAEQLK